KSGGITEASTASHREAAPAQASAHCALRIALYVPALPDTVWSIDFVSDALACERRFRTFNVVGDFNDEALHIEVETSINSHRLVRVFEQIKRDHGLPQIVRSDSDPKFLGEVFTGWLKDNGVAIQYI
ncbi:DDE-type integrase/transposase/recombinase, partial [Xanthomonas perforans]|uniref:DDE-type integrase/transposase/recombinase n=1 Tax=Xanthomonas perforans TaxID=442694 RepID=UPI002E156943